MKKITFIKIVNVSLICSLGFFLLSLDHTDAPNVANTTSDISDFYAFEGDNPNNTVFVATLQGPLAAGDVSSNAIFDEDVLVEFNIDNTGDFVEDLVIQAVKRGDSMFFFGPIFPSQTGVESLVETSATQHVVQISTLDETFVTNENNMSFFAGPRRDASFFDFNRFNQLTTDDVILEGFLPPGEASDLFDESNVLAIVVEIPNILLGSAPTHVAVQEGLFPNGALPNSYNVWLTTHRKQ